MLLSLRLTNFLCMEGSARLNLSTWPLPAGGRPLVGVVHATVFFQPREEFIPQMEVVEGDHLKGACGHNLKQRTLVGLFRRFRLRQMHTLVTSCSTSSCI